LPLRFLASMIASSPSTSMRLGCILLKEFPSVRRMGMGSKDSEGPADGPSFGASRRPLRHEDLEPYWTLAEAVVWILTRDLSRVEAIPRPAVDDGLPADTALMEELIKLQGDRGGLASEPLVTPLAQWQDLPMGAGYLAQGEVFEDLASHVRDGRVKARGQRPGATDDEFDDIAPSRWDTLQFQTIPDGLCGVLSKKTL
jgi:hypothetical protein